LKVAEVDAALADVFDDIEAMASSCRFSDCRHGPEPGCAVRAAIDDGSLSARRLQNYMKLLRENERNSASIDERRAQGRAFSRLVKEVKALKRNQRSTQPKGS
jgi:ribosome biogenesis GTPase